MFSIIVPTFNNIKYLQITLKSIVQNSKFNHDIIVHVNEGTDGTLDYLKTNNINHTYSDKNLGLCSAVNIAAKKASTKYILYCHDDMYLCPNWDYFLYEEVKKCADKKGRIISSIINKSLEKFVQASL